MKNAVKFSVIITMVVIIGLAAISCASKGKAVEPETFTVSFDSKGGSEVAGQQISDGGLAAAPTPPTKTLVPDAGLWAETPPNTYTFAEWQKPDGTAWNFAADTVTADITLNAQWTAPSPLADIKANDIAAVVAYANNNPGAYTLLINDNVDVSPQTLNVSNVQLTILGSDEERELRLNDQGRLFLVGASGQENISLTLGENITLVGLSKGQNGSDKDNNSPVVRVQNGASFTMLEGSKITGNTNSGSVVTEGYGAAVVATLGSSFNMKGGEITGNTSNISHALSSGGVYASNPDTVISLEGGNISGNTGTSDVFISMAVGTGLTLSGNTAIGNLTLTAGAGEKSIITVNPDWTGSISKLNLRGNTADMPAVIGYWFNAKTPLAIMQAAEGYTLASADVEKVSLGNFMNSEIDVTVLAISDAFKDAPKGFIIASSDENMGALVARP